MPGYSYRYRRRYGRRYSRYRRYSAPYYRYRRRRTGTSSTASSRGRLRVRVPVQQVVTLTVPAGSTDSNVLTSSPYFRNTTIAPSAVAAAVNMPLYVAYTNLYDQVKCDGVVSNLSVVSPIGQAGVASALQLIVAYDRTGTRTEVTNPAGSASITVGSLFSYSSSVARSAINNSVAKMTRSCWASDIQERTTFHDCTIASNAQGTIVYDSDFGSNDNKIGYFAPLTLVGLRIPAAAPQNPISVTLLIEQTYYFTFRNPKFGGDPGAAASTRMSSIPVVNQRRDVRSLDREADMGDVGGLDDEDAQASRPLPHRQNTQVLQHDGEDPEEYLSPALQF